jgi:hypothetical protein
VHGACWADLEVTAGGAGQCIEAREGEAADVICTGEAHRGARRAGDEAAAGSALQSHDDVIRDPMQRL